MAGLPAAVISATVLAPERQRSKSARAKAAGMSSIKGDNLGRNHGSQVRRLRLCVILFAGLMNDVNVWHGFQQLWQGFQHRLVDGMRALAAAEDQKRRTSILRPRRYMEEFLPHRNPGHMAIAEVMAGRLRNAPQLH